MTHGATATTVRHDTAARWKASFPFDPTYVALTLTALLWSTNFIIGRAVRDVVSPAALKFLRWAIALLILVPITLRDLQAHRATLMRHWKLIAPVSKA
jgi:drug/metabolite transporter (DMT)-like permease